MRISDWSTDVCSSDLAGFALLVPVALGYGYHLGNGAGEASGYARARDEVAAASWANTVNGKLARQLDQTSTSTIPLIANCSGKGWSKTKQDGQRVCYAAPTTGRSEEHTSELQSLMRNSSAVCCLKQKIHEII